MWEEEELVNLKDLHLIMPFAKDVKMKLIINKDNRHQSFYPPHNLIVKVAEKAVEKLD